MLELQLFGGCALLSDGVLSTGNPVQKRRLALLALLALSGQAGVSRDKIIAYFWPESDRESARHFLSDSVFTIRKALGKDVLISVGDDLRLNSDLFTTDVMRFDKLIEGGRLEEAVGLYNGPLLDGFFVGNAPEFERRVEEERGGLGRKYARALEELAERSEANGDWMHATELWKRLAVHDPCSGRVALRVMRALDASGDTAGAIQHANRYEKTIGDTLELPPDANVTAFAELLKHKPASPPTADRIPRRKTGLLQISDARIPANADSGIIGRPLHSRWAIAGASATLVLVLTQIGPDGRSAAAADQASITAALLPSPGTFRKDLSPAEEARELYSQGRYSYATKSDPKGALDFFRRSARRDPSFAPAYAGMADIYSQSGEPERARAAAIKSLSLDSSIAESHAALAYVLAWYDHRWAAADAELRKAIAYNPGYARAFARRAYVLVALGRFDEAMGAIDHARELDPESWNILYNHGMLALQVGRNDEALSDLKAALALEPTRTDVQANLAWAYWAQGRGAEAAALLSSIGDFAAAAAVSTDPREVTRAVHLYEVDSLEMSPVHAAMLYVRLGQKEKAFQELDRAYATERLLPLKLRSAPLNTLRGDVRYGKLLKRLGLQ